MPTAIYPSARGPRAGDRPPSSTAAASSMGAIETALHAPNSPFRIQLGVAAIRRFALDDFGTGANSLSSLNALPFTRVKIDGSFIRDILTNPRSEASVRGVVELARRLRLKTVAEYVETEAIAATLRRLGVDYAQGYAFGRAEPLEDILRALAAEESQRLHRLYREM